MFPKKIIGKDPFERQRQIAILKIVGLLIVILVLFSFLMKTCEAKSAEKEIDFYWTADRATYEMKIEKHIRNHYVTCNPQKYQGKLCLRALRLISVVLDTCAKNDINPYIVAAIITLESNWDKSVMERSTGAYGLMQVNYTWKNKDIEYTLDPEIQIETGISILKTGFEKCGTVRGALAFYATGQTCKPFETSNLRYYIAKQIEAL